MDGLPMILVRSIVTVVVIVVATRWVLQAKGAELPQARNSANVYGIKRQWRAVGVASAIFWLVLTIWEMRDLHSRPDGVMFAMTVVFVALGIWIASGLVITDETGISKRTLGRSRLIRWNEITEIRLHPKQGGAIELRAGPEKLVIDSRFVAFDHLLHEIESHTRLPAITTI
jgi:hypothetical protein